MSKSDETRLRHMLEAAREAAAFRAGRSRDDLLKNRVLTLALVRCVEVIGEAAAKVSPEVRVQHPAIPWADIVGMRNRLIHAYFDIDLDRVFDTLTLDLPQLITEPERILSASTG